ncbi:MAG: hypothetical protein IKO77_02035 [Bacteroidales bacterium]|nr:hypothetical protein [Bacteroidales bacterium]
MKKSFQIPFGGQKDYSAPTSRVVLVFVKASVMTVSPGTAGSYDSDEDIDGPDFD